MSDRSRDEKIARFRQSEQWLREAVAGLSDADLSARPIAGEWSIREVVQHLADGEIIAAGRLRRVLAEPTPELAGYDAAAFGEAMHYATLPVPAALAVFGAVRNHSAAIVDHLEPEQWNRSGIHTEYGEQNVERIVEGGGNHVEAHVNQIREVRAALGK
ncbi:MAG: DinB family protein [Chloroflexota bacterium]